MALPLSFDLCQPYDPSAMSQNYCFLIELVSEL